MVDYSDFRAEIESAINRQSMENGSNTPDFILAQFLTDCLCAFDAALTARTEWYGPAKESLSTVHKEKP